MLPLWVWFSRLIITEETEKMSCVEYCSNRKSKLITIGHLEFVSEFEVTKFLLLIISLQTLQNNFMNPKTALVTSLSEAAETFAPNQTSFMKPKAVR